MTPLKSILKECKYCMNGILNARGKCNSDICKLSLHNEFKSNLRRIKAHCIDCIPEQSIFGVQKCDGKILNPEPHTCPLWPFRLGHDPKRKGKGNPDNLIFYKKHGTEGLLKSQEGKNKGKDI